MPKYAADETSAAYLAQVIKPQAKALAADRGIGCVEIDHDELRGIESTELRLL